MSIRLTVLGSEETLPVAFYLECRSSSLPFFPILPLDFDFFRANFFLAAVRENIEMMVLLGSRHVETRKVPHGYLKIVVSKPACWKFNRSASVVVRSWLSHVRNCYGVRVSITL